MPQVTNFNFECDLSPVIWWKLTDATRFKGLVKSQQEFLNAAIRDYWKFFNEKFLNINTANSDGLSMWGRLFNVPRPVYTDSEGNQHEFTDDQYRLLLRARIFLLTYDGSTRSLNKFFKLLFPDSQIVVEDNYNMTVTITFVTALKPEYEILFKTPFLEIFLPRPSGVEYITNLTPPDWSKIFGFEGQQTPDGSSVTGFDQGTFYE